MNPPLCAAIPTVPSPRASSPLPGLQPLPLLSCRLSCQLPGPAGISVTLGKASPTPAWPQGLQSGHGAHPAHLAICFPCPRVLTSPEASAAPALRWPTLSLPQPSCVTWYEIIHYIHFLGCHHNRPPQTG